MMNTVVGHPCQRIKKKILAWRKGYLILPKGKGFMPCGLRTRVQTKPQSSQNYVKMDAKQ
jgi:hypothetical protein